jgi:hypothetical protein
MLDDAFSHYDIYVGMIYFYYEYTHDLALFTQALLLPIQVSHFQVFHCEPLTGPHTHSTPIKSTIQLSLTLIYDTTNGCSSHLSGTIN